MVTSDYNPLLGNPSSESEEKYYLSRDIIREAYKVKNAIVVQAGLLVLLVTIFIGLFTHPINGYFIGHPILNSFGLVALSQALLITQPAPLSPEHKTLGGKIHGILNSTSVVLFLGGYTSIFYNKHVHNANHITTWHALFGITTYVFLGLVLLVGVAQFWAPILVFGSIDNAKKIYKYHRIAGYVTLGLISFTVLLALDSDYNNDVLHIPYWSVFPAIVAIFGGLIWGLKKTKLGF
jgi:uncharacterized membrane protein